MADTKQGPGPAPGHPGIRPHLSSRIGALSRCRGCGRLRACVGPGWVWFRGSGTDFVNRRQPGGWPQDRHHQAGYLPDGHVEGFLGQHDARLVQRR